MTQELGPHRAGMQRTFHVHTYTGPDRGLNQFMILVYRYYRLVHAETQDSLDRARDTARKLDEKFKSNALIRIIDEHGTEYDLEER